MRWIARLFLLGRIAPAVMFLIVPTAVLAAPIRYTFSGATYRVDDPWINFADIPGGTPFSGSFTFDPQIPLVDYTPVIPLLGDPYADPTTRDYGSAPWDPPLPGDVLNATMDVGGLPSFAVGSPAGGTINIRNDEMFGWPTPIPSDTFRLSVNDASGRSVEVSLVDPTGQALAGTALPSILELPNFGQAEVKYRSEAGLVAGHITRLEVAAVPEPSTLAVLALGGLGLAAARRAVRGGRRPIG